jgi:HEAT repeat protein
MGFLPPLPPTFDAALRDVRAKGTEFRLAAAVALGEPAAARRREAIEALGVLAHDPSAEVRAAAIEALGRIGDAAAVPAALEALDDRSPAVREAAMGALGGLGGEEAQAAVRRGLDADHPEVRFQALCALARHPQPEVEGAVAALLHDPDPEVAAEAATTLAALSAESFTGALAARLDADATCVRDAAALALAHLRDRRAIPHLRAMVRARRAHFDALLALGALGAVEAADDVAAAGAGLFTPLVLKAAAGAALAELGDPRGLPLVRAALRAFRGDARAFAVEQVGQKRLEALLPELLALADRPRGVDPAVLIDALRPFAEADARARAALARLERRGAPAAAEPSA